MSNVSKRGRPQDPIIQKQRKEQLMDAAYTLLEEKSYRTITIREIADRANMKSAMISYYFKNKEGLFIALIERKALSDFERFSSVRSSPEPIKAFIEMAVSHFSQNPSLSRFIADEIMSKQGPLGEQFIEMMPKRIALFLPSLIESQQNAGNIRDDIDPKWGAFSLMTMIVMPFIAAPVRERAWNISQEEISSPMWIEHIYKLFMAGCQH